MVEIIFVRSAYYDTTIVNTVRSLSKRYSAIFLGWNRQGIPDNIKREMQKKTYDIALRLRFISLDIKAPYGRHLLRSYIPMIFYLPLFWSWIFATLIIHRPKVVHAFDLDTVFPCYLYKKLFRKKLVFHIIDRYAMTFIPKKFHALYSIINSFEEALSKRSDVLITVSKNVMKSFRKKPSTIAIILNCLEDHYLNRDKTEDGTLILGYSGAIIKGRGLEQISTALKNVDNVKLFLYGPVIDRELFDKITRLSNIEYKGFIRIHDEYLNAIISTDAIIAIYTEEVPSHHITMHNKTLEAMMGGIPIITNLSPALIKEIGFGIIVEYGNIGQIRSAIIKLRDDTNLRKTLGSNGRKAFLQSYNWGIMEAKLYELYEKLL